MLWVGTPVGLFSLSSDMWRAYNADDGLPGSEITALLTVGQDLYVGTLDGLARRHGANFQVFYEQDGLPANHVTAMAADGTAVWIGTTGGLGHLEGERIESFREEDGLLTPWVTALAVESYPARLDDHSRVWVGTPQGLCSYQTGRSWEAWTTFTVEQGLSGNWIKAVAIEATASEQNRLWVASQAGGLDSFTIEPGTLPFDLPVTRYSGETVPVPTDMVTCLVSCRPVWPVSGYDVLLAGTASAGAVRGFLQPVTQQDLEDDPFLKWKEPAQLLFHDFPHDIRDIKRWRTWLAVGTSKGLVFINVGARVENLYVWDGSFIAVKPNGQVYLSAENFPVSSAMLRISSIIIDQQDVLWAGTEQSGILGYDGEQWQHITRKKHGLTSNNISTVAKTGLGAGIYAATYDKSRRLPERINWFDGEAWHRLDTLFEQYRGRSGTSEGVPGVPEDEAGADPLVEQIESAPLESAPYTGKKITGMASRKDGIFFASVYGLGLCEFDGHAWTVHRSDPGSESLISNFIKKLELDGHERLWILTDVGLGCLLPDGRWFSYDAGSGMGYTSVQDMVIDDSTDFSVYAYAYDQQISTGCVIRFNLETWIKGAKIENIQVLTADHHYLWLGTNTGIVKFRKF